MLSMLTEQLLPIVDVLGGDAADQGVAGVAVGEEGADGEENLGDRQGRGPLGAEDVQADGPVRVDVWMVNTSGEGELGRLEWIVRGEVDVEEKHPTLKWGVCRTKNGGLRFFLIRRNV